MAAPTISAAAAAALAAASAATVGGSVLASKESASAQKAAALEAAKGPVRGGTARAGGMKEDIMSDPTSISKLGQNMIAPQNPVYGSQAQPIDLNSLFKPQQFGQGYSVGPNPYKQLKGL